MLGAAMSDLFSPSDILSQYADREAVDSFLAYRKKHKRAPLTDRGAKMLAKSLAEIVAQGGDATEALDMAQEHGWQTIKPEWYFRSNPYRQPKDARGSASFDEARERALRSAARGPERGGCEF